MILGLDINSVLILCVFVPYNQNGKCQTDPNKWRLRHDNKFSADTGN